jgi:formate--tetrahydrofolate ligase
MRSDIDIASRADLVPVYTIASSMGLKSDEYELYGQYKAKLSGTILDRLSDRPDGKLILVTAINPTPAGEGKTTTTVGLGQALCRLGHKAIIALREPSLGPVFGIKGGAAGGGYAQVLPMEDINLHFTGDMHAITAANNLLSALIDNHIHQGNHLDIDPRRIAWKRCIDMNDRQLRHMVTGLGGPAHGMPHEDGFIITAASEVMAILCLAHDLDNVKKRIQSIVVAWTRSGDPVTAGQLNAAGAMAALLKDAIKPNLVQTIEQTPALIHGGPFANIAHGCSSLLATRMGLKLGDYLVTEAGFGADLGAEKFFDITCRTGKLRPSAAVLVASVRALKYNGGVLKDQLAEKNTDALKSGLSNLDKHLENMKQFGIPCVVALNRFEGDAPEEVGVIEDHCRQKGTPFACSYVFERGGEGGLALARTLIDVIARESSNFRFLYSLDQPLKTKIEQIATRVYGADGVNFSSEALNDLERIESMKYGNLPVCMAKTQFSLSDDPSQRGRPRRFRLSVQDVSLSAGAGFVVVRTGHMLTLPGLPARPAAESIDLNRDGTIKGLY